jgi:hypothetical protein
VEALESHLWSSMRRRGDRERGGEEKEGPAGDDASPAAASASAVGDKATAGAAVALAAEDADFKEVGNFADRQTVLGPFSGSNDNSSSSSSTIRPGFEGNDGSSGEGKETSSLRPPNTYAVRKLVILEGSGSEKEEENGGEVGWQLVLLGYCRVRALLGRVDVAGHSACGPARSLEEAVRAFQRGGEAGMENEEGGTAYLDVFSPSTTALLGVRPLRSTPPYNSSSPPVAVIELSELPGDRCEVGNASYLLSHRSPHFFITDALFDFSDAAGSAPCHAFGLPRQGAWSCFPGLSVRVHATTEQSRRCRLSCYARAEDVLKAVAPPAASTTVHGGNYARPLALGTAWYEAAEAALLGDEGMDGATPTARPTLSTLAASAPKGRRVVVCGGVKQGKSSFARFLVNRALHYTTAATPGGSARGGAVAYVDLDPGQTEFSAPGLFALSVVTSPLLGPPFSHAWSSSSCCNQDSASTKGIFNSSNDDSSPVACAHLFYFGSLAVDGSGVHRIAAMAKTILSLYFARYSQLPLVVNTMGWVDGLGLQALLRVLAVVKPDAVCAFPAPVSPLPGGAAPLSRFPAGAVPRRLGPEVGRRYAYLDDAVCEWIATQSRTTSLLLLSRPEPAGPEGEGDDAVALSASVRAPKRSKLPGGNAGTVCGATPAQLRVLMWQACFLSHTSPSPDGARSRMLVRTAWDARPLVMRAALAIPLAPPPPSLRVVSVDPTVPGGIMRDVQASLLKTALRPNEVLAVFTHTHDHPLGREDPSARLECCGVCVVVSVDSSYLRIKAPWRSSVEKVITETIALAPSATRGRGLGFGPASSLMLLRVLSPRSGGGALVLPPEVSGVHPST